MDGESPHRGRPERPKIVLSSRGGGRRPGPYHRLGPPPRRRRRSRPTHARRLLVVLGVSLVTAALLALLGAGGLAALQSRCSLDALQPLELGQNSFVFAAGGSPLGAIPSAKNRQPLSLRQMSPWLVDATVAIEDRRFWQHGGLDYRAIARAMAANVTAGSVVQGASTIPQQLARNLYIGSREISLSRKVEEACLAVKLAERWPKQRILVAYLNSVFYGNHALGAEAAAQTYFSRRAGKLDVAQAALVAGLPQAPSRYDPFRRPAAALARRNDVLAAMRRAGYIDERRYRLESRRPLGLEPGRRYVRIRHPFFFSYVRQELAGRYGERLVRQGGLRIRTTLDPRLQRLAVAAVRRALPSPRDPAAALVAIDPRSGAIRAMAAVAPGRKGLQFNLAAQGRRQAGSAFKPFVLAAALERGVPLSSRWRGPSRGVIPNAVCETNGEPWLVSNYGDQEAGTLSLLDATVFSTNTIYAQVVAHVGPDVVVRMAHRLGIRSALQPVCSLALGSQAVSPLEMTAAYATLAAGGVRRSPQAVEEVRTPRGETLVRLRPAGSRALSPRLAEQVTGVLRQVMQRGTGTAAALGRPAAGKTGTAERYRDAWFCGYVPQLAACVWVGYPQAEIPLLDVQGWPQVFGGSIPARIWREFMAPALVP